MAHSSAVHGLNHSSLLVSVIVYYIRLLQYVQWCCLHNLSGALQCMSGTATRTMLQAVSLIVGIKSGCDHLGTCTGSLMPDSAGVQGASSTVENCSSHCHHHCCALAITVRTNCDVLY
jgi:hypothetical protein